MAHYYVATRYKKDDILLISEDDNHFYHLADRRTYSDLGIHPAYHYKKAWLTGIKPAMKKDFEFFRIQPPKQLKY